MVTLDSLERDKEVERELRRLQLKKKTQETQEGSDSDILDL